MRSGRVSGKLRACEFLIECNSLRFDSSTGSVGVQFSVEWALTLCSTLFYKV